MPLSWRRDHRFHILKRLYEEQDETLDRLPYSEGFADLVAAFNTEAGAERTEAECYRLLLNCRKQGKLARKGHDRRTFRPEGLTDEATDVLADLYRTINLGLDQLAYTATFDSLCQVFREKTGAKLSRREVWQSLHWLRRHEKLPRKTDRKVRPRKVKP